MLLKIHADNPSPRKIQQVVDILEKGGIIIYPTDTVYGLGCDITNHKAVERICRLVHLDPKKAMLSLMCQNISQVSEYSQHLDNDTFKLLKRNLPGPFTFILKSNNSVPKLFKNKKRTIGVRVPNNNIVHAIVEELGRPILTTSLKSEDEIVEYFTDPFDIHEDYKKLVDVVIDGGIGGQHPSAVINLVGGEVEVIREGPLELK